VMIPVGRRFDQRLLSVRLTVWCPPLAAVELWPTNGSNAAKPAVQSPFVNGRVRPTPAIRRWRSIPL
jgi:hypothetical protein